MKEIYIFETKQSLRYRNNNLVVFNHKKEKTYELAVKQIKRINVFGNPQITTNLLKALAINKTEVHYYSENGKYIMSMNLPYAENYLRQKEQFEALQNEEFSLELSKSIIKSKIRFQADLLKAYDEDGLLDKKDYLNFAKYYRGVHDASRLESILGYEGRAAKSYFHLLGLLVPYEFKFNRRTKRPPKDPFNALISFGYSILYGYIKGAIIKAGLHPGFSALHQTRGNHATLASDLMEEWRCVLIDDVAMQSLRQELLTIEDFKIKDDGTVHLTADARKIYLQEIRHRMLEKHFYFGKYKQRFVFLYTVDQQMNSLKKAFKQKDNTLYQTIGSRGVRDAIF